MRTWPALEIRFPETTGGTGSVAAGDGPDTIDSPDRVQAALLDFTVIAIDEGAPDTAPLRWRIFFQDPASRDAAAAALHETFDRDGIGIAAIDVDDEDWAARSQAALHAVRVRDIVVAPPWDVPVSNPKSQNPNPKSQANNHKSQITNAEPLVVVIQPSMGFGTGHHATTRLCLAALQTINLRGSSVIDAGTGSGVLAIAASRLGAAQVLAIDVDSDAIESARENLMLNPEADVTLGVVDLRGVTLRPFDVVLANLTCDLLVSASATLRALSRRHLILSGFMVAETRDVLAAFDRCSVASDTQEDGWGCLTLAMDS